VYLLLPTDRYARSHLNLLFHLYRLRSTRPMFCRDPTK
jgi:hypothetical protein